MGIRLLAFDLDGTALTEHKFLSERNRQSLLRAGEKGVLVTPASGRVLSFLPQEILALPNVRWAITSNGAGVYQMPEKRPVWQSLISMDRARKIQQILEDYPIHIEYYLGGNVVTKAGSLQRAKEELGFPKEKWSLLEKDYSFVASFEELFQKELPPEKINLPYLPTAKMQQELWNRLENLGELRLTSSAPDNIEINAAASHKGAALAALCERLSIAPEEVMAIGDNGNDVTMLEFAGYSVAVADGSPEALAVAKYHTGAHTEDGFAQAVERFVL